REEGHSVIIITHHIDEVLAITDRVTVLRAARNAGHVVTRETNEEELSSLMIGRKLQKIERKALPFSYAGNGLQLDSIQSKDGRIGPLSLSIPAGSIVGIAGVDGNGQKALAEVIMGIRDIKSGTITLDGKSLQHLSVKARKALGIGYISDDRLKDGLVLDMDVQENFMLSLYRKKQYASHGLIDTKRVQQTAEQAVSAYAIKTASLSTPVRYLSGGNQQKLILARELGNQPKVVVACQPTRGLDIGSTEEVHSILLDLRRQGCSVVLISSDLDEILSLSDKIAVIYQGTIMDVLDHDKVDMTYLGLLMAGSKTRRSV
ncbi:MAG: ATP-binding cassette domain-containing protein, partial [Spirochaetia bacterium]|nr:ATP-binding cassette domain-containing protein [Spirochaetia bacterium]